MSTITLYGIANCDTVRKARRWLADQRIDYRFHDFRADGLELEQVRAWLKELGPALVNKRSTSWTALNPASRDELSSGTATASALATIVAQPPLNTPPLLETGSA